MEIAVDGWRASVADWQAVRDIPGDELPPLSAQQQEVARKLGISQDDYARSALAGQRSQEALLKKAERLGYVLGQRIRQSGIQAQINRVLLRTAEHKFDVELQVNGRSLPLRIAEEIVDDYFDSGSVEAEQDLSRILDRALVSLSA